MTLLQCVAPDTLVDITTGYLPVSDLLDMPFFTADGNRPCENGFKAAGIVQGVKITTCVGLSIKCSENQGISTPSGKVLAGNLEPGDAVRVKSLDSLMTMDWIASITPEPDMPAYACEFTIGHTYMGNGFILYSNG